MLNVDVTDLYDCTVVLIVECSLAHTPLKVFAGLYSVRLHSLTPLQALIT